MPRVDIIDMVRDSKLKGRGGAGFPTGIKWNFAAAEKRTPKYIMCNADEGEPGTFKDRLILTEYPDLVMEGMTIGARAIGAALGLIYLRAEYAYLRRYLEDVIKRRTEAGPAGLRHRRHQGLQLQHHGGHGRRRVRVRRGDGPHRVAGRASAVSRATGRRSRWSPASSTGRRWSTTSRRWPGCPASWPTAVDWFKSIGTNNSTGHKLFSVSGDCDKPGVYEFPFGITIAELLWAVGGDHAKAVQIGGASGRCVPREGLRAQAGLRGRPHRRLHHRHRPGPRHARAGAQHDRLLRGRVLRPVHPLPAGQREAARRRRDAAERAPARRPTWTTSRAWPTPCR